MAVALPPLRERRRRQRADAKGFYGRRGWRFVSIDDSKPTRMTSLGVPGQPSTVFVNAKGQIVCRIIGSASEPARKRHQARDQAVEPSSLSTHLASRSRSAQVRVRSSVLRAPDRPRLRGDAAGQRRAGELKPSRSAHALGLASSSRCSAPAQAFFEGLLS